LQTKAINVQFLSAASFNYFWYLAQRYDTHQRRAENAQIATYVKVESIKVENLANNHDTKELSHQILLRFNNQIDG